MPAPPTSLPTSKRPRAQPDNAQRHINNSIMPAFGRRPSLCTCLLTSRPPRPLRRSRRRRRRRRGRARLGSALRGVSIRSKRRVDYRRSLQPTRTVVPEHFYQLLETDVAGLVAVGRLVCFGTLGGCESLRAGFLGCDLVLGRDERGVGASVSGSCVEGAARLRSLSLAGLGGGFWDMVRVLMVVLAGMLW